MVVQFYRYSFDRAKADNELDDFRESEAENQRCIDYIQDAKTGLYANAYENGSVDKDGAYLDKCINEFGLERMMFLAANTVKLSKSDERWSEDVKEWATEFNQGIRHDRPERQYFFSQLNVGIVNTLAKRLMEKFNSGLNLFTCKHCLCEKSDITGKVVVLDHRAMKEAYWSTENQLWLAFGGSGCSPNTRGRAIYATCLYDGDKARWNREHIIGVLKDEFMPDWAKEKLEEIQNPEQRNGMELQ